DSLDVFGVHCVGGILGAIATGILVNPALGGAGVGDYVTKTGELVGAHYVLATQVWAQVKAVVLTLLWSGIGSAILYKIVDVIVGPRVTQDEEREGLCRAAHGETAAPPRVRRRRGGGDATGVWPLPLLWREAESPAARPGFSLPPE